MIFNQPISGRDSTTDADLPSSQTIAKPNVSSIPQRTIKFRAWDKWNNIMINPEIIGLNYDYFAWSHSRSYIHNSMDWNGEEGFVFEPILMQFTGLKDKNGIDIYECDIVKQEKWVKVGEYSPAIGIVKYKMVKFTCECIGDWLGSNADLNGNAEVIGNVFQNPELLG